ncbi:membrane protein insertion efficiency factor YidD [Henriciella aquimarina]|uniref:membrane protein insertion efficiency factor YidD n=1 Tax=Henriciella aquimarina TaxID=545261 RepID=UPI0009FF6B75|nr:membrane protein insertion efficiency factor YidD [Henriciella aquimarina]
MSAFRRKAAHAALKTYKLTLSPTFQLFGAQCRHVPSCSEYCAECVSRHGLWAGGWMTLARLSRCRPGGSRGFDPVPESKPESPFWAPWRSGDWACTERPFPDAEPEKT